MGEQATIQDEYKPLWKDRKRILGLPVSFTKYEITGDRLIKHKGFFRTETDEILLYRILDIKLVRTLGQKLFGVGTITLYSADQTHRTIELKNIRKPQELRRFISKIVEQERTTRGVAGREIYGAAGAASGGAPPHEFADLDGDGIPD